MGIFEPHIILTTFLIFARVGTLMITAPFFGSEVFYKRVKLFLSIVVTIVMLPAVPLDGAVIAADATMLEVLIAIFKEMAVGISMGLVGQIIFGGVQFGGQFVSIQTGVGFANIVDPRTQTQNPIYSQLFTLFGVVLLLIMGGEKVYLRALAHSFEVVPIGTANLAALGPAFIKMAADIFIIGVKLASPFIVIIFMMDLCFAIFARIMPQANIFFVSLPLKVGGGALILYWVMPKVPIAFNNFFELMYDYLSVVISALGS